MTHESSSERLESLIDLTNSLAGLIERENTLLSEHRPSAIASLQSEKAQLAAAYATAIRDIANDRTCLSEASETLITDLREITQRFESSARTQKSLLEGARRASEGIVGAVVDAASKPEISGSYSARMTGVSSSSSSPIFLSEQG